jgi:light-regulated signal transduction histidine kinase (bacteriophytochrome)
MDQEQTRARSAAAGIRIDAQGRITAFDDAAAELFGCRAAEAIGKPLAEVACSAVAVKSEARASAAAELDAFAYAVAHDLRAPLRHIEGFAGLLESEARASLTGEALHFLEVISAAAKRMNGMLEGLLAYSRAMRGEIPRDPVNMQGIAAEAVQEARKKAAGRDIAWELADLPPAPGDRTLLRQVWSILLDNAVKFTRNAPAARVRIGAKPSAGGIEYFVSDNGAGLDMSYAGKLLKLFQRVHHEKEFEGLGVGLAVADRIVARHGGVLRIEGRPGEGATASFTLPAA